MEILALSPAAQEQAKALRDREGNSQKHLRVAVIGGGCSGLSYKLGWDVIKEDDIIREYDNGVKVLVDEKSALYLMGALVEFHDSLDQSGFEIINPNVASVCGCGKSFS